MKTKEISKFERYFLYILFFELFAGGGGRLIAIGPLSIRQILFVGVMAVFLVRFILNADTETRSGDILGIRIQRFSGYHLSCCFGSVFQVLLESCTGMVWDWLRLTSSGRSTLL